MFMKTVSYTNSKVICSCINGRFWWFNSKFHKFYQTSFSILIRLNIWCLVIWPKPASMHHYKLTPVKVCKCLHSKSIFQTYFTSIDWIASIFFQIKRRIMFKKIQFYFWNCYDNWENVNECTNSPFTAIGGLVVFYFIYTAIQLLNYFQIKFLLSTWQQYYFDSLYASHISNLCWTNVELHDCDCVAVFYFGIQNGNQIKSN